jgi:sigma-B regulation protein RsbU (phosphoserine phosphatase)
MYLSDLPLTASQVLETLHRDGPYLFLGAAFTSLGLASAAFAFLDRKFNAMLFWLALFAILYGQRLWLQLGTFTLLLPASVFIGRLRSAINYLVPIPGFFYFDAAGFLGSLGSKMSRLLTVFFLSLFFAAMVAGPKDVFELLNTVGVIACLSVLVVQSVQQQSADKDFVIIRGGLIAFVVCAFWDNLARFFRQFPRIEPLGFAVFLGTLGYVAAKRTLHRDQQFNEIQKELEIARRIQTSILPSAYPHSAYFQVATRYVPMTAVAGDFYDFLVANDSEAGLLVADVSGHGVPAALIASMVKLAATSQRVNAADPAALLSGMNQALCGNTQNQFVTAAYVHLDVDSASLRYAGAGHPPMLLLRAGEVLTVEENGLILAAFTFATYSSVSLPFKPGDRLLLYTDGLIEAANIEGAEFGQHRLSALLSGSSSLAPEKAADHIISAIQSWSRTQNDDLTLLICDCIGG